jgi:hypothetical protein
VVRAHHLLLCVFSYQITWAQSASSLEHVDRIFVGSFGNSAEAQQVRQAVIDELRRHGKPGIADSAAQSDAALTGSGEVFVKGYYSLNPRARSIGEDAHPVYGGYLSVELKGRQNEILWSYLVTPHRFGPQPIGRNLAAQIVKKLREALPR